MWLQDRRESAHTHRNEIQHMWWRMTHLSNVQHFDGKCHSFIQECVFWIVRKSECNVTSKLAIVQKFCGKGLSIKGVVELDPRYRMGGAGLLGVKIFFVIYFRKVQPICQIALPKKLGSSDAWKTLNLHIYCPKLWLRAEKKVNKLFYS